MTRGEEEQNMPVLRLIKKRFVKRKAIKRRRLFCAACIVTIRRPSYALLTIMKAGGAADVVKVPTICHHRMM